MKITGFSQDFSSQQALGIGGIAGGIGAVASDAAVAIDFRSLVDASDTTADYLGAKLAAGSNIVLTTINVGGDEQIQIATAGTVSYGSNANDVGNADAPGASSLVSRADHVHRGVHLLTSNSSNPLYGDVNLLAGPNMAITATGQTIRFAATGGSGLPWFDMVADGGLDPTGATDNTTLFNTALATGTASGTKSCRFYFPPGIYLVAGRIAYPTVATSAVQIAIVLQGNAPAPISVSGPLANPGGYSIIKSTCTTGSGAIFAGSAGGNNNIQASLINLIVIFPDNPPFTGFDFNPTFGGGTFANVQISCATYTGGIPQPTHAGVYGLTLPGNNNSNWTNVDGLSIAGFTTCLRMGELAICRGLVLGICTYGIEFPFQNHESVIEDMQITWMTYGLNVTGICPIDIRGYDAEHHGYGSTWPNTVYDLNDPNNWMIGHIDWWNVLTGSGPDHSFTINGGSQVLHEELGSPPGGSVVDPTTTEGDLIYRHSGVLARLGVGAAGTVLHGGTDPAYSAVVEGDLSLSNVTTANVSITKHGFAPILPNDATKYLDGSGAYSVPPGTSPGGHFLVISSGHATPLVFDDIVQTSGGDDFVYTS